LLSQEKLAGASLLIFANKQDLAGALSFEDIAKALELDGADIGGRHWVIFGCSAFTGDGLISGFDWLVDDIASRIFMMS
jgi:ADP-ribosylation factor-like protein 2